MGETGLLTGFPKAIFKTDRVLKMAQVYIWYLDNLFLKGQGMEIKKPFFIFFLLFFLKGIVPVQGDVEESSNNSTTHTTKAITNENVSINDSPVEGESPFKLSGKAGDLFFLQRLVWDEAMYAVRYTVVLEQKSENLDVYMEVLRRSTERTYIDITLPPGEYRFQVISFNVLGHVDTRSEWNNFIVHNPITLLQPGSGNALNNNPLSPSSVMWSTELSLRNSRVVFSRESDPTKDPRAIVQYVAQGTTTINLPPLGEGIWYWTVLGETSDGLSVSAVAPFWFTLLSLPLLSSPQYTRPSYNEVITLDQLMAERKITFKWEQVPEANAYIFSLYGYSDKQDLLVFSSPSPETSFELTDLSVLNMNDYTWQVEAVLVSRNGTIERRGKIQQQSFVVNIQRSDTLRIKNMGTTYGL